MNKYILKVMRYQDNPELFSVKEMRENDTEAYAVDKAAAKAARAAKAAAYAAYATNKAAVAAAKAAVAANKAAVAAAAKAAKAADIAKYWVNEYFKFTDENTQDYTNEVERLK